MFKIIFVAALFVVVCALTLSAQSTNRNNISRLLGKNTTQSTNPDPSAIKVARLHYSGGGDWYWGNSAVPNLLHFIDDSTDFPVDTIERTVTIEDADLFRYPFLFATGHGVISFSIEEKERLRRYLAGGGFLFVNDSYGMKETFKKEVADLYPERRLVEIPLDHALYHSFYDFPNGPPKIHEHDNKPPRGYGIIIDGRLVLYFLVESDIGDGWENPQVHKDPPELREAALKMGVNIVTYALLY
ncbi:MAG: DUF4159 domain-containing protein [candidate division Zixibacteria bacterium]|nr:DUF4159 domain-containing protein [candidate division Zixibacteria bacterium]